MRKQTVNATLAVLLALGVGSYQDARPAHADDQPGAKQIKVPTSAPKKVPCVSWLPEGKPKVAMLCIHGFSLHKGCFAAFGKEMAKDGIATYAMDLRGFGELKDNQAEHTALDFDGCLADVKSVLQEIHNNHPGLPVIVLGESLGGGIALRATALYPDLVSGLISSVPARDRFGMSGSEAIVGVKAGLRTIFGGFSKPMNNVASAAVQKISDKEEVRKEWSNDPLMRTNFSPKEFLQLDRFQADNLEAAGMVAQTPVLFIQGTNDKLIRPAGTWKLFERLATPHRQMVLSKNAEHLIFEEGQFRPDDLSFVVTWISKNITPLDTAPKASTLKVVASKEEYSNDKALEDKPVIAKKPDPIPAAPEPKEFQNKIAVNKPPQINFWIELYRNGKVYRCNNKMEFKSGDAIRFHLIPESDGYAYLVMKAGTTGKSDVLFPNSAYGTHNFLSKGRDYPIPAEGWMQFDQNPGTEQLGLVFGHDKMDVTPESLKNRTLTCFVSPSDDGAKDLCPTRMKLSWDDPTPVVIPEDFEGVSQVSNSSDSSLVRLMSTGTGGTVSASIELMHGK